jgi:hypothetical protein
MEIRGFEPLAYRLRINLHLLTYFIVASVITGTIRNYPLLYLVRYVRIMSRYTE